LLELLQGLIVEGVDCKVLVPKKGPLLEALDYLQVEWKIIGYPKWIAGAQHQWLPKRIFRTVKASLMSVPMSRAISKWQCDVVCSNTIAIGAGAFAAKLAHRPHVWHLHEFPYRDPNLQFDLGKHRTARLMDRLSTFFIANSNAVADDYAQYIRQHKIRVIYQAVSLRDELGAGYTKSTIQKRVFTCIIVGSLHIAKGQDEAILALAELERRGVDAELLLIGDGSKRFHAKLLRQAKVSGLESRIKFIGYTENPAQYIRMADVILICSRWEAFGRVTVEAMLAGKPVIGTAHSGGTAELIQDGETGLLYQGGNYDELADKIQYLYENPEERLRLGKAARAWASDRFTQERYAKEVFDLLKKALVKKKLYC
jgi:glycosyltransferase involved in cell wall biosynthesis